MVGRFVGDRIGVDDGGKDVGVYVREEMVGDKVGEFGGRRT